jgi:hypothetical protein
MSQSCREKMSPATEFVVCGGVLTHQRHRATTFVSFTKRQ